MRDEWLIFVINGLSLTAAGIVVIGGLVVARRFMKRRGKS
jgi:hypothetical protein